MAFLEVEDIKTYYGNIQALKGISLTVEEGECVTLIGSNGAGKSTTLRSISGLTPPQVEALKRVLLIIPTLLGIMLISFAIVQFAPGGPIERIIELTSAEPPDTTARNRGRSASASRGTRCTPSNERFVFRISSNVSAPTP